MLDLNIHNLSKIYLESTIFSNVNIQVKKGEKIALLGENGTGKTTIFKIISGIEYPNSGEVSIRKGVTIGYLKQKPEDYDNLDVKDVLMLAFKDLEKIKEEMFNIEIEMSRNLDNMEKLLCKYDNLQKKFEALNGYEIDEKLSKICDGLKFDDDYLNKKYNVLSGGEKTRVNIGKLLLDEPDVLLLDEPTNHLDIETTEWLEEYINNYKGSVLIISHDRYFMDKVIEKIYELKQGKIEVYHGNYSYYLKERAHRYETNLIKYNQQQRKITQMEEAVKRFRDWGQRADNEAMFVKAKAMEKRIDKMDKIDKPILDTKSIKIGFNTNKKSSRDLIVIKDFNLYAGEKELIKNANYTLRYGEKVGLIGANGTGKSTLIKCIINEHKKHEGIIKVGNSVNIGYLEQDIIFIDNNKSILEIIKDEYPDNESNVRSYLARFKFYGDDVFKNVEKLSGGEKIRLRLAILMKRENLNLLILDEPTNHIDIKTKEVLEETLINFDGSILFISHDRYILNLLADKIIEIRNKELIEYVGGYEYYKNEIKKASVVNKEIIQLKNKKQSKNNHKINKKKKVNYVKLKLIEDEISIIEKQIEIKKEEINKNPSNYELLTKIIKDIKELEEKLEIKMEEWYDIDK